MSSSIWLSPFFKGGSPNFHMVLRDLWPKCTKFGLEIGSLLLLYILGMLLCFKSRATAPIDVCITGSRKQRPKFALFFSPTNHWGEWAGENVWVFRAWPM